MNSTLGSVVPLAMFKVQKLSLSNILYLSLSLYLSSSLFVFVFFVYCQEARLYSTSASTELELEGYEVTKVTRVTGVTMAMNFFLQILRIERLGVTRVTTEAQKV